MFWIFAAIILILCVGSVGFRHFVGMFCLGVFGLFVIWYLNDNVFREPATVANIEELGKCPEPASKDHKPTLDELLADC